MANVLVYTELAGGRPSAASLSALQEGRRIGSAVGATVYALLACAEAPSYGADDTIATLGSHGADKVILLAAPGLERPSLFATHGPAVLAACEQLPPSLLLFPASAGGCDIAPRVATRLGAAYADRPRIEIGDAVTLVREVHGGGWERRLAIDELERPVVATLAGAPAEPTCECDAEVVVITPPALKPAVEELEEGKATPAPRVLVLAEGEVPAELAAELLGAGARVLVGAVVCEPPGSVVVALGRDPEHPDFQRARLGVVGEPAQVLSQLLRHLLASA